jgi:hypothetical protein
MQNFTSTRRDWLKQGTLAAFGLGLNLHSLGNEERLPRSFGAENGLINLGSNENLRFPAKDASLLILVLPIDTLSMWHRFAISKRAGQLL